MSIRRFVGRRLARKLTLIIGAVSTVGLACMVLTVSTRVADQVRESTERYQEEVARQTAADIQVTQRRARFAQLDEEPSRLAHGVLDRSNRRDLAAQVKVQQLEAVEQAGFT